MDELRKNNNSFTIDALVRAVQDLRDEFQSLRKEIMPRDEVNARIMAISDRLSKIETSPNSVRGWLGLVVSLAVAVITGGGCFITTLIGAGALIVSILSLAR